MTSARLLSLLSRKTLPGPSSLPNTKLRASNTTKLRIWVWNSNNKSSSRKIWILGVCKRKTPKSCLTKTWKVIWITKGALPRLIRLCPQLIYMIPIPRRRGDRAAGLCQRAVLGKHSQQLTRGRSRMELPTMQAALPLRIRQAQIVWSPAANMGWKQKASSLILLKYFSSRIVWSTTGFPWGLLSIRKALTNYRLSRKGTWPKSHLLARKTSPKKEGRSEAVRTLQVITNA